MVCQPVIFLFISFKNLALVAMNSTINLIGPVLCLKSALDHCKLLLMPDVLGIDGIKITFAQAQVMNGIEYIGFSDPVIPDKTIYAGGKRNLCIFEVLKIQQGQ